VGTKIDFKLNKSVPALVKEVTGGDRTLKFMALAWHRLYMPWVPMASGTLANNADHLVEDGKGVIHHKSPYAQRLSGCFRVTITRIGQSHPAGKSGQPRSSKTRGAIR